MEFWAKQQSGIIEPEEAVRILRLAWSNGFHTPTFVMLLSALTELYEQTRDAQLRAEIDRLLTLAEDLCGSKGIESDIRGYLAAADGDFETAKAEFRKATEERPPADQYHPVRQSAFGDQSVVLGEVDEAIIHYEAAKAWRDPGPRISLSIILEKRDPVAAQAELREARRLWKGPEDSFDPKVDRARRQIKTRLSRAGLNKETS
jgi:hypothetical protein